MGFNVNSMQDAFQEEEKEGSDVHREKVVQRLRKYRREAYRFSEIERLAGLETKKK